ncbi:alkylated DNA repair protein alkB homolog 8 isoform X2 [Ahaetulla prasina]|uniref:alkylated DNA repair protein alkB homolog 8 isoform X2 n=1 Tax=Ahaetulla prasina TaxID=499056 RepID=UPI002647A568|nr:alkylated DNA repair protein alkB homolog 8 isoform X2 [Ahaetulla prasina]
MEPDDITLQNKKISKAEKKLRQKQMKARYTLLKHEGIECVSYPTKSLVIANGGLGNGVGRCQLHSVVEECGQVENILMPPNKPYSFVQYGRTADSKQAYDSLNGKELILDNSSQKVVLYFNYVEKVPWEEMSPPVLPPGLRVIEELVSPEEEKMLLENINWTEDEVIPHAQKCLKHRRVKHFGYEFRYDNNNVDQDRPLPGGIPPHIDTHSAFEDEIISLSLGAEIVMDFKHPDGRTVAVLLPQRSLLVMSGESRYLWTHGITPRKFDVVQASEGENVGSITADIRKLTLNKRGKRISFTFRKIKRSPCCCSFPSVCDSRHKESAPSFHSSNKDASVLEQKYVHEVYEDIARHFSNTRHSPWPQVVEFLKGLPCGAIVADVGCGNGKYLGLCKDLYMLGCDRSKTLVDICGEKEFQAFVCDALTVPIRSGSCDACISIAVIHHFSTVERRLAVLCELTRLLRPGGKALVYVWAMEQEYKEQKSKYLKGEKTSDKRLAKAVSDTLNKTGSTECQGLAQPSKGSNQPNGTSNSPNQGVPASLPVHTNRTSFETQDVLVPWHLKDGIKKKTRHGNLCQPLDASTYAPEPNPVFHRYYHVFCEGELELLCKQLDCIKVQGSYYDQGNWCVVLEKQ